MSTSSVLLLLGTSTDTQPAMQHDGLLLHRAPRSNLETDMTLRPRSSINLINGFGSKVRSPTRLKSSVDPSWTSTTCWSRFRTLTCVAGLAVGRTTCLVAGGSTTASMFPKDSEAP